MEFLGVWIDIPFNNPVERGSAEDCFAVSFIGLRKT